jgi:hypothetical protein
MTDQERRATQRSMGPGGVPRFDPGDLPPRDPRDLVGAGPALRIEDSRHPGGPALDAEIGRRPVIIAPEEPMSPADEHRRAMGARADLALLALFIAALFFLAGATFYLDGSERGDALLVAAGSILLVSGAAVLLAGLRLRRAG